VVPDRQSHCNRTLLLNTFDDTEWDLPASGAKVARLDKACEDLATQIKSPTLFPIVLLQTTLARVRGKSKIRHSRTEVAGSMVIEELVEVHRDQAPTVVDNHVRTRAASRRHAAIERAHETTISGGAI
jgi:hypothetical protein